jgi:hypothetical protein
MNTENTSHTATTTTLVLNPTNGEVKVLLNKKKEETGQPKAVAAFAKNTRYSIYNNGGGYTGL